MTDLVIEDKHVTELDPVAQALYTDLDFKLVVTQQGRTSPLVAEKALVRRQRHKVGEVVVRKIVENDWVQIPIHCDKLIIEQTGKSAPLAAIDLG